MKTIVTAADVDAAEERMRRECDEAAKRADYMLRHCKSEAHAKVAAALILKDLR